MKTIKMFFKYVYRTWYWKGSDDFHWWQLKWRIKPSTAWGIAKILTNKD